MIFSFFLFIFDPVVFSFLIFKENDILVRTYYMKRKKKCNHVRTIERSSEGKVRPQIAFFFSFH